MTLLAGWQEGHLACKKHEWWGNGMIICLDRDADLHMAQLMPLPLTVSCSSKIQIGFTFLVPANPGSPGKRAVKRVCVCIYLVRATRTLPQTATSVCDMYTGNALCVHWSVTTSETFLMTTLPLTGCDDELTVACSTKHSASCWAYCQPHNTALQIHQ